MSQRITRLDIICQISRNLMILSFCIALVSGMCIAWYYIPAPEKAFFSLTYILENVFGGSVVITIHFYSVRLFLAGLLLNCTCCIFTKRITIPPVRLWSYATLFGVLLALLATSGYILQGTASAEYVLNYFSDSRFAPVNFPDAILEPYSAVSIGMMRTYFLHACILPLFAGSTLYLYLRIQKQLLLSYAIARVSLFSQGIILLLLLIVVAAYGNPVRIQDSFTGAGTDGASSVPFFIQLVMMAKHSCPVSVILVISVLALVGGAGTRCFFRKKRV